VVRPARNSLTRDEVHTILQEARKFKRTVNLTGTELRGDFSGLDFTTKTRNKSGGFLSAMLDVDFRHAKLNDCTFRLVDLACANLRGADLTSANLVEANLYCALLEGSCLKNADLRGSNLHSAELQNTNVEGANFAGARFGETRIGAVDLSGALGLDEAVHRKPSAVGPDTLHLTARGLSSKPAHARRSVLRFLRNAGFDDDLLSIVRSWIGSPVEFYSIFLSHSSLDKEFARKLYADLRSLGVNCWLDEREILPGDNILESVDSAIKVWDKFVLVCSRNSLTARTGWWVEQELERAFAKERELRRSNGVTESVLIPITLDDFVFRRWNSRFRASVLDKKVGDFTGWRDGELYSEAVASLQNAIDLARGKAL
jgi:uncharacterized protein YjbI with pentapeptide repeats